MAILNNIHKLSKDYRVVMTATFIAAILSLIIMKLPGWMATSVFWELLLTAAIISVISLIAQFYYYSRKLSRR